MYALNKTFEKIISKILKWVILGAIVGALWPTIFSGKDSIGQSISERVVEDIPFAEEIVSLFLELDEPTKSLYQQTVDLIQDLIKLFAIAALRRPILGLACAFTPTSFNKKNPDEHTGEVGFLIKKAFMNIILTPFIAGLISFVLEFLLNKVQESISSKVGFFAILILLTIVTIVASSVSLTLISRKTISFKASIMWNVFVTGAEELLNNIIVIAAVVFLHMAISSGNIDYIIVIIIIYVALLGVLDIVLGGAKGKIAGINIFGH